MTKTQRFLTILPFLFFITLMASLIHMAWNVDGDTGNPVKTFIIHVEYGANEDMLSCPGTPGRVLTYSSLPDGAADIECATPN